MSKKRGARFERLIVRRYLQPESKVGFLSLIVLLSRLGIILGVAALIIVLSVMASFRQDILEAVIGASGHIEVSRVDGALMPLSLRKVLSSAHGKVLPVVGGQAVLISEQGSLPVEVIGIRQEDSAFLPQFDISSFGGEGWPFHIDFGTSAALGLKEGDTVKLVLPQGQITPVGWSPRIKTLDIEGAFPSPDGGHFALLPFDKTQIFFRQKEGVSHFLIMLEDLKQTEQVSYNLSKLLKEEYSVKTWAQLNSALVVALKVERLVMGVILSLVILIAAFNIVSSQMMLVKSKAGGIAILRTMGASRMQVMLCFIRAGTRLGFMGALIGGALGVGISLGLQELLAFIEYWMGLDNMPSVLAYLSSVEPIVNPLQVILSMAFALTLSVFATLYPAWQAGRVNPARVLRYE